MPQSAPQQKIPVQGLATMVPAQQQGRYYGLPGVTRRTRQRENNDAMATTLSASAQVSAQFIAPFKTTDVIERWVAHFQQSLTLGGASVTYTNSRYAPYNTLGPVQLNFQNQFNTINVTNGIELAWRQALRPQYYYFPNLLAQSYQTNLNPTGSTGSESNYSNTTGFAAATGTITPKFRIDFPAGLMFDEYYNLDPDGNLYPLDAAGNYNPNGSPVQYKAFVSPQLMAGNQRYIQPRITYNAIEGTSTTGKTDANAIITSNTGTPTFSGTSTIYWQRIGIYQPVGYGDTPMIWPWQYTYESTQFSLSGLSAISMPVPYSGQILSVTVRLFDPAATFNSIASIGDAIDPNTALTECDLVYGSGLYHAQDRPFEMQSQFNQQHGFIPFPGFICWDMALDEAGRISNKNALNTLNTSGITVNLTFASAQSSSAYAVVMVEGLKLVATQ